MEPKTRKAGKAEVDLSKVPAALETERGLASIAVNHPCLLYTSDAADD
jgi:hypothetical protein